MGKTKTKATTAKDKPRRTQQERREGTIRKLLDAATETLVEVGWAEASVQRICARAGVSQGALFRHFASREALMVAVGEDVGGQLLLQYRGEFERLGERRGDVMIALRLVRDACRSQLNQAWYELRMAARTNDVLRRALGPVCRRYYEDIERLARLLLPELAEALGDRFTILVGTVLMMFDGEVMQRYVVKLPRHEDARLELLAGAVQMLSGHSSTRASR